MTIFCHKSFALLYNIELLEFSLKKTEAFLNDFVTTVPYLTNQCLKVKKLSKGAYKDFCLLIDRVMSTTKKFYVVIITKRPVFSIVAATLAVAFAAFSFKSND